MLQSMGSQRVGHDWVTEQQQSWERNPHFLALSNSPTVFFPDIKLGKKMFSLCNNYQVNKTKGAEQYPWRSTSLGTIAL